MESLYLWMADRLLDRENGRQVGIQIIARDFDDPGHFILNPYWNR
jgi:hypothetical protein